MQAAARAAAERWPDVYRGPGRARLICRDDDPPSLRRGRGGQARRRRDRRARRRGVGLRRGAVGEPRLRQDSRFAAGAGGGIGRGGAAGDRFRLRAGARRRAASAQRRGGEPRGDRRGAAVAAAPRRRPARPRRVSARRPEPPPPSLRICAAAAADRRAAGERFGARRFLDARGGGQCRGERRPRRSARSPAARIRAQRRAGARLRPALAQHAGGALVPAVRRQLRLRFCRRAVSGRFASDGAAAVCDDRAALSRSARRQAAALAGQMARLSPRRRSRAHRPVLRAGGNRAARRRVGIVGRLAAGARPARRAGGGAGGARRRGLPGLSRRGRDRRRRSPTIAPPIDASVGSTRACAARR